MIKCIYFLIGKNVHPPVTNDSVNEHIDLVLQVKQF